MKHKEQSAAIAALNLPGSVLVKSQTKTFRAEYGSGVNSEVLIATVRWDDQCGNGHNSFAVTGSIYGTERIPGETTVKNAAGRTLWNFSAGCCHDDIAKRLPELAHLIRWHLFDPSGPMHYIANTVYLAGARDHWGLLKGEKRQHTSRGRHQNEGVEGVPQWELELEGMPEKREIYAKEKPADFTIKARWVPCGITGEGKARELDSARSVSAWPDATDEDLTAPGLEARLIARLPPLIEAMKKDIETLGFTF